jgi:hypothetical protein
MNPTNKDGIGRKERRHTQMKTGMGQRGKRRESEFSPDFLLGLQRKYYLAEKILPYPQNCSLEFILDEKFSCGLSCLQIRDNQKDEKER